MVGMTKKAITLLLAISLILSQATVLAAADGSALEIAGTGVETEIKLSVEDLKAMPSDAQVDEEFLYNSKTGEKTAKVKGVRLAYVLKEVAKVSVENAEVIFEASDGYQIDPQLLEDIYNEALKYTLAYEVDGQAINDDDLAETEEVRVYRKQKEAGEFGTVFKLISKVTVGEGIEKTEEDTVDNTIVFTDITEEFKYAEDAINELVAKGIVEGVGDGKYSPQSEFTRAQFCKMVVLGLNLEEKTYGGGFSDVAAGSWYANYVQAAVDSGLFTGNTDGTFLPNKSITRQEIAAVAARAAVFSEKVSAEKLNKFVMDKSNYTDKADVKAWAANGVAWLEAQGVFTDIAASSFEPERVVNRAEAAVVVFRTLFK